MFGHYLIASLRNMAANRLQSAIAIAGLALGLAAAILAGLVVQNQRSYDDFFADHDRLYMATVAASMGGRAPDFLPVTPHDLAARLRFGFPEIEAVAELKDNEHGFSRGPVAAREATYSAAPDIFRVLRFRVLYGNLDGALTRPDDIVIPRAIARKYFGREDVVGETLTLDRKQAVKVTAVIADLPANGTNLTAGIFLSGVGADSDLAVVNRMSPNSKEGPFGLDTETLVKLKQGVSVQALQARMTAMRDDLLPHPAPISPDLRLMRLDALHLSPDFSPGIADRLAAFSGVALLILALSMINYINLTTARAARRGVEVGIRKAMGAGRGDLMLQFLGEALSQGLAALLLALALVEWLLPAVNAFFNSGAAIDYRDPLLGAVLLAGTIALGVAAGFYPALVLSGFRPAAVLKGLAANLRGTGWVRQGLVMAQFAVLVGLAITTGVVLLQHDYAARETHGLDTANTLFVYVPQCDGAFADRVRTLPGVRSVACSDLNFVEQHNFLLAQMPGGATQALYRVFAGPGLMELYGEAVLAGRALRQSDLVNYEPRTRINVLINETAARKLNLGSPRGAIGHVLHAQGLPPFQVVGVVPDFSVFALEKKIDPMIFYYRPNPPDSLLHVRLTGRDQAQTLAAIDQAWNASGAAAPIQRISMGGYIENLRLPLLRESEAFGIFASIAMLLGCLGLFGLSVSTAGRRIKEIGVRKAMGARDGQILWLLLWQFAKPVLWGNLIAWPMAFWAMRRWLSGFAYHVGLPLWLFPAAGAATLAIALLTVAGQSLMVARQRPVLALRYE